MLTFQINKNNLNSPAFLQAKLSQSSNYSLCDMVRFFPHILGVFAKYSLVFILSPPSMVVFRTAHNTTDVMWKRTKMGWLLLTFQMLHLLLWSRAVSLGNHKVLSMHCWKHGRCLLCLDPWTEGWGLTYIYSCYHLCDQTQINSLTHWYF